MPEIEIQIKDIIILPIDINKKLGKKNFIVKNYNTRNQLKFKKEMTK